jgi:hypothetical protein
MPEATQQTEPTQVQEVQQQEEQQSPTPNGSSQQQSPEVDSASGKFVYKFQPTDSDGKPIGKEYRFLYTDHQDLVKQLTDKSNNEQRYIQDLKTGKRSLHGEPAQPRTEFKPRNFSQDEAFQTTMELQNPATARDGFRKFVEAEFGAPLENVRQTLRRTQDTYEKELCRDWALQNEASGYYICPQNATKLAQYLLEHNLAISTTNLDLAFEELKDTLVPRPSEQSSQSASTDSRQSNSVSETPSLTRSTKPQTASTGIMPGQFSGQRSTNQGQTPLLSAKRFGEIEKMSFSEYKKLQRHSPEEVLKYNQMKAGIN